MRTADRVLALILFAAVLGLAAVLLGPLILAAVLEPLARQLWSFLRVFVLCVNQAELWNYLVLALAVFLCYRLLRPLVAASRDSGPEPSRPDANLALGELEYWRYMFAETPRDERERAIVRRELSKLLLSAYSARDRVEGGFELLDDLRSGRSPLPEGLRAFLFDEAPPGEGRAKGRRRLESWLRRVSGREAAAYRRAIEAYLDHVESLMEAGDAGR